VSLFTYGAYCRNCLIAPKSNVNETKMSLDLKHVTMFALIHFKQWSSENPANRRLRHQIHADKNIFSGKKYILCQVVGAAKSDKITV
jgi:hypothetical protein